MERANTELVVLVAEDDAIDSELLTRAVNSNGVVVDLHIAHDGEETLAYLRGEGRFANRVQYPFPDLLVLDLKMPLMDGLDVLRWLNAHPACARLPKVMLSGSSLEKDVEEAYRLGVNTFFAKPNSLSKLGELMRRIVEYWSLSERPCVRQC